MKSTMVFYGFVKAYVPVIALLAFTLPGLAQAEEACGDGGDGSQDIQALVASFDEATQYITVDLTLCDEVDNKTKYRVHFDHTAPFAPDADRNGDTVINADDFCVTTSDDTMMHRGKRDTGPGSIEVGGTVLSYWVSMAELSLDLSIGDTILVWADTQDKGIEDRAPDTDDSDGCAKPEIAGEYIELVLSDEVLYAIGATGPGGGIVFHVTDGGLHGLEAAPEDQSTFEQWGCFQTDVGGIVNSTAFPPLADAPTGAAKTTAILSECLERPIAASVASDYIWPNGQTDGYLPDHEELDLMYTILHLNGLGGFAGDNYWSSSEYSKSSAWFRNFNEGFQNINSKDDTLTVRAVRAF